MFLFVIRVILEAFVGFLLEFSINLVSCPFLLELVQEKNKQLLPLIPEKHGIRLPADKHCLTGINCSIVPDAPLPPPKPTVEKYNSMMVDTQEAPVKFESTSSQPTVTTSTFNEQSKRGRDAMEDDDYDF
ncbi:hypothetical protein INT46_004644 [Mucor plumbeus]|uniref:Uncharacterized protein n=1 Tax=Mucor plumbeus TaxID=97098 RepID=A0A8H7V3U0_9FUNG|nr:hypothetical protein INT46_004644 [Mucor plumbeus]